MKSTLVIQLSIFITFVICGFWVGTYLQADNYIFNQDPVDALTSASIIETSSKDNSQQNILVITISRQNDTITNLVCIWLVTQFSDNPSITFQPIFPTLINGEIKPDDVIQNAFQIIPVHGQSHLSGAFLSELSDRNIEWDHYLIIDHDAIMALMDSIQTTSDPGVLNNSDNQGIAALQNESIATFRQETLAVQVLCNHIEEHDFMLFWDHFKDSTSLSISSDKNLDSLLEEWQSLLTRPQSPLCILPLDALSPIEDN